MKETLAREWKEYRLLMRAVPAWVFTLFVLSVFSMNLLANKSISLPVDWLALDCGFSISWFSFLSMDMITRHFGPKGATQLSITAMCFSLFFCLLFFAGSRIPGVWGESFVEGSGDIINTALDRTFGGTWYVILGSALAFFLSSIVNNVLNWAVGRALRRNPDSMAAYALRSCISTAAGQFVDNLTFALAVSHVFFGWSLLQCITCSITGMILELLSEAIFSPFGYLVCRNWSREQVGAEYLEFRNRKPGKSGFQPRGYRKTTEA